MAQLNQISPRRLSNLKSAMPLTIEEASLLVANKKDLYTAMRRNHYVMPKYKERMVTMEWMLGILRD